FKKILYTLGGLPGLLISLYIGWDYSSAIDQHIITNKWDNSGSDTIGRAIVAGLKADRKDMFGGQLLRTLAYMAIILGLIWLYLKNMLKPVAVVITLAFITLVDLFVLGKDYLNEDNYISKEEMQAENFTRTAIDEQISADKDLSFRVYNSAPDRFSASDFKVSAFHKAIGGYHPAKLRIYQDIIERYLSGSPNPQILNMLNAKYIIVQNPQNGQQTLIPNTEAYGNTWLVKNVKLVKDAIEEIQSIGTTDLKDTAIVQQAFSANLTQPVWDSAATISLTKFDNDTLVYVFESSSPQFAVFSEVYFPDGWNAYVDGKKTEYVKANYILRGLSLPAGKHSIQFVFEPAIYKKGIRISYIGSWFVLLLVLGGFFMAWRESRQNKPTTT
ncbi:MAG: YfhO family protein, partial [Chitinophagaceae bacterium]